MLVKDIEIPDNHVLIDVDVNQIILDNGKTVSDPVGNLASSFTVNAQVILADKEYVRQLSNIFKKAEDYLLDTRDMKFQIFHCL